MRIWFCDHPEGDYLAAQLYLGLSEEFGAENVWDYPYKKSYHGELHVYPSVYETDPGSLSYSHWYTNASGIPMGTTSPFEWMRAQPGRERSLEEIRHALHHREIDLIVLASPRRNNVAALREVVALVGRANFPPLVMMDGEDYEAIRWDLVEELQPRVYFKRELVPNPIDVYPLQRQKMEGRTRVLPLPLAPTDLRSERVFPNLDVYLPGGGNVPGGIEPYRQAVRDASPRVSFERLSFPEYLDTIARSRICVAVRGHSQDSLRSWEMLACRGPLVLVQRHTLLRPAPFENGVHVVHFDGPTDLRQLVERYLVDESLRARIAEAGFRHFEEHHTSRARARYLVREGLA